MPKSSRVGTVVKSVVATIIGLCVLAVVVIMTGLIPANADATPGVIETWVAKRSLSATLNRATRGLQSPLAPSDSTLTAGVRLYGTYCAVCHGTSDGKPSAIAQGLYQKPPQFEKHDVADDPVAVTYWKITHGIRLTGMPAFDSTLSAPQRWAIALFLSRQDSLPPTARAAWKKLPSAAQDSTAR